MIRSVITAAFIGVLGGFWIALINGSIEIFQNYVEGVLRYQVVVNSVAVILVGAVVGALVGANIHLAFAPERADGFVLGSLGGVAVGIILVLAQMALVALATLLREYNVEYDFLLTRFSGIIAAAALIGAVTGLLTVKRSLAAPLPGAVVGALTAAAFALPAIAATLIVLVSVWSTSVVWVSTSTLTYALPQLPVLLAGAGSGAIIGAVYRRRGLGESDISPTTIGVLLGTVTAVTASSASFHYVVLGLFPSESSFSLMLYVFRVLVGLLFGVSVGLLVTFATLRMIASRGNDADMISPE